MTATGNKPKSRSRRAPYPNSVLDRKGLIEALEDANLYGSIVQPAHISAFYHALHRQHYPPLPQFVENYYAHEDASIQKKHELPVQKQENTALNRSPKNSVATKKHRNKMQLPRAFLNFLCTTEGLVTVTSTVAHRKTSGDRSTTKLAIRLHDGQLVESVLMRYVSAATYGYGRASLCVSSQCGCAMGCTFCATGTMGLSGNLTSGEILEQVIHANRILAQEWADVINRADGKGRIPKLDLVRNVVFMGMGEPLDNYRPVVDACRALIDNNRWNLAHGRVTVSTVGIIDKIRKLTLELPEVNLAVSLHAPNQEMRSAIVPSAKYFPIEQLIDALDDHMMAFLQKSKRAILASDNPQNGDSIVERYTEEERIKESIRRRAMIEYVMLEGDTSSLEAAHELGKLCEGRHLVVNLIPYNQTDVTAKLRCPSKQRLHEFRNIVASYGSFCTIRRTMGADIDSACGQLITIEKDKADALRDIEDTASSGTIGESDSVKPLRRHSKAQEAALSATWTNLDTWIVPLAISTGVAATCFVVTATLFLRQRRQ